MRYHSEPGRNVSEAVFQEIMFLQLDYENFVYNVRNDSTHIYKPQQIQNLEQLLI